jgi:hypothetical protein
LASLARSPASARQDDIEAYFAHVWHQCVPGELYVSEAENVRAFTQGLLQAIRPSRS